ncbi:hypothetical protein [Nonomuraea helvata]|uniref:Lipoprotein n=1 Tax=Nonomuraea helvata TaxID=37484 RepID=A0ABV5S153_9ACTN
MRAWVAVLAAAAVLAGGCGGEPGGSGAGQGGPGPRTAAPALITMEPVPPAGSGELPEAEARVGLDCQTMLRNRDFEAGAEKMGRVASSGAATDGERAIARVCEAAANANMKKFHKAMRIADQAKGDLDALPPALRMQALELLYHTELVSAAGVGDTGKAREAFDHLTELGRDPSSYVGDACAVAPDPAAFPECTTATATATGSPPAEQGSPAPRPEESSTEPTGPVEETTSHGSVTEPPGEVTSEPAETGTGGPTSRES